MYLFLIVLFLSEIYCPVAPTKINVFLVPHTHDDVGWLQTVQGYYNSEVKNILDTAVAQLAANPQRKFIYVEQAYFTLWWNDNKTTDEQRNNVKQFVKDGQWEFVIGSWVMPDEACTTYSAIIDQMTLGHQFLLNTFNVTPTKGWQIDPFGASTVTPVLEKLAGFDAHLIDRISFKDKYETSQRLEFIWQGSPSLGNNGQIFTEIMNGGGSVGVGYCDWLGSFDFSQDPVNAGNVAKYGNNFINMVKSRIGWYKSPNMLAEWGCDFAFQDARPQFHSMDQVVQWLQQNQETTGVYVKYATLSEYYEAVFADKPDLPPVYQGDFFPYFGDLWWTGYYTSRVELKGWVRRGEAAQRAAEIIYSFGRSLPVDTNKAFTSLNQLRVANGYAQHHDGVTGTSVPEVVDMYKNYLVDGINVAMGASSNYLSYLVYNNQGSVPNVVPGTNAITNIGNGQKVAVILFNSLGWTRSEVVKIPVNRADLSVTDSSSQNIPYQISEKFVGNVTSKYHLFFAAEVAPFGFKTFFVSAPSVSQHIPPNFQIKKLTAPFEEDVVLQNSILSVTVSATTGRISTITNKKNGVTVQVDQNLLQYRSKQSGAYAFAPSGPAVPVTLSVPPSKVITGPVVQEISQVFSNYAKQTIRLYSNGGNEDVEDFVELDFDLGPLASAVEVITLFSTNITTQKDITTDDNGFEWLYRPYQAAQPLEGNYYPLVYSSYIKDQTSQLTVVSERSHGVSSQKAGGLEVMLHRNPDMGDNFGPALTDKTEVYPALRVVVDSVQGSSLPLHRQPYLMNFPLSVFTSSNWESTYNTQGSFLKNDLPSNVHLLSVYALNATSPSVIVRLTHLFAVGEHPTLSQPVTVDLSTVFTKPIKKVIETTLSANKVLNPTPGTIVKINPKEIHTFLVDF